LLLGYGGGYHRALCWTKPPFQRRHVWVQGSRFKIQRFEVYAHAFTIHRAVRERYRNGMTPTVSKLSLAWYMPSVTSWCFPSQYT